MWITRGIDWRAPQLDPCRARGARLRRVHPLGLYRKTRISIRLAGTPPAATATFRELAVDLIPTNVTRVSTSTAKPTFNPASSLEFAVGQAVAVAAAVIGEALGEFQDAGLTPRTRNQGGEAIAHLFRLKLFLAADFPDFDAVAREQGAAALRAATDGEVSSVTCALLIDSALEILARVVAAELN